MTTLFNVTCWYAVDGPTGRKSTDISFIAQHKGPIHEEEMDESVKDYVKKKYKADVVGGIKYEEFPEI